MYVFRDTTSPWRGLGQSDASSTTTLNYAGMPTLTPDENAMIATPLTAAQLSSLSAGNQAFFNQPTGGLTSWLAQNPGVVTLLEITGLVLAVISLGPRK